MYFYHWICHWLVQLTIVSVCINEICHANYYVIHVISLDHLLHCTAAVFDYKPWWVGIFDSKDMKNWGKKYDSSWNDGYVSLETSLAKYVFITICHYVIITIWLTALLSCDLLNCSWIVWRILSRVNVDSEVTLVISCSVTSNLILTHIHTFPTGGTTTIRNHSYEVSIALVWNHSPNSF